MTSRLAATVIASVVWASIGVAHAQDKPSVEDLQRKLEHREKVINELLKRVERLERRVGVDRSDRSDRPEPTEADEAEPDTEPQQTRTARSDGSSQSASAPGKVVVEEGDAERALERSLTSEGALLLRAGRMEVEPSLTYTRETDTSPALTSKGNLAFSRERNVDRLTGDVAIRLGLPLDTQLELGLPYQWRSVEQVSRVDFSPSGTTSDSAAAMGDFRVGIAKTLVREGLWRPDLIGRVTWDTASGDDAENGVSLGGGFNEVRGSLTAVKRQDPIAFVAGLGYQHVFENDNIEPGASYTSSLAGVLALSPETSINLGVSGGYQEEIEVSGREVDGSDRVIGQLNLRASTLLAPGVLFNVSTGIGLTEDANDFNLTFSVPIQFDAF